MMTPWSAAGEGFQLRVSYPATGWYAAASVVPALRSPHELFAFSNRPLQEVPATSDQNRPLIGQLDSASMFIWGYYEVFADPETKDPNPAPIPDYSRFSFPFEYAESQAFPSQSAYDWSASDFVWRRVGLNLASNPRRPRPAALTVMVWEGTASTASDVTAVEAVLSSVAVS
jgi:hypothetical protein